MKVSLNTIKQYIDFELPPVTELVKRVNEQLGKVEQIIDLAAKYKDVVIVKVIECDKHPNADKLSVCMVDDGGVVADVERDERGMVRVVCGAPNVRAGIFAAWLPPRATVPATYDDPEPFVLSARELRGVVSNGMLAAADELAIGTDHDGILEIKPDEWKPGDEKIVPGVSFAKVYGLDDTVIDIENKMFTHRPDLFGQLGVARELSAILKGLPTHDDEDTRFENPSWYWDMPEFASVSELSLAVYNDTPANVPRVMFAVMNNVKITPSPLWLQCALVAMGSKPINNIVDVTNYVMLLTAQPTHAYDYDKLRVTSRESRVTIGARMARSGETITLLNGKTYELTADDIVITDGEGPVGLGGIMGGKDSEVSAETTRIVLEVATFDMYTVRKSSMRHGVFTDALTRFNKGQSPLQNNHIMHLLMMSVADVSEAAQASDVFDLPDGVWVGKDSMSGEITLSTQFINERLGTKLLAWQICGLLRRVNFAAYASEDVPGELHVTAPFWRTDIVDPEDIVEEVGRLYGFDTLPRILPQRSIKPVAKNVRREAAQQVRDSLARAGANEVLTYSFVHKNTLQKAGQNPAHAYQLSNALSPDLQYYRLSLTPSLLDKIHANVKAGYESFALFEQNKVHYKGEMDAAEPSVPNEDNHLALVLAYAKNQPEGAAYYQALQYLGQVTDLSQTQRVPMTEFDLSTDEWGQQLAAPYAPERSAVIVKDGQLYGVVGEFKQAVAKAFKLPEFAAGFEVHTNALVPPAVTYRPLSRYPSVTQDVSLRVNSDVTYQQVYAAVQQALAASSYDIETSPLVIYQADGADKKTITLRIKVTSDDQTLTDGDVAPLLDAATTAAKQQCGAERV